jgi:hypothetical protein
MAKIFIIKITMRRNFLVMFLIVLVFSFLGGTISFALAHNNAGQEPPSSILLETEHRAPTGEIIHIEGEKELTREEINSIIVGEEIEVKYLGVRCNNGEIVLRKCECDDNEKTYIIGLINFDDIELIKKFNFEVYIEIITPPEDLINIAEEIKQEGYVSDAYYSCFYKRIVVLILNEEDDKVIDHQKTWEKLTEAYPGVPLHLRVFNVVPLHEGGKHLTPSSWLPIPFGTSGFLAELDGEDVVVTAGHITNMDSADDPVYEYRWYWGNLRVGTMVGAIDGGWGWDGGIYEPVDGIEFTNTILGKPIFGWTYPVFTGQYLLHSSEFTGRIDVITIVTYIDSEYDYYFAEGHENFDYIAGITGESGSASCFRYAGYYNLVAGVVTHGLGEKIHGGYESICCTTIPQLIDLFDISQP